MHPVATGDKMDFHGNYVSPDSDTSHVVAKTDDCNVSKLRYIFLSYKLLYSANGSISCVTARLGSTRALHLSTSERDLSIISDRLQNARCR